MRKARLGVFVAAVVTAAVVPTTAHATLGLKNRVSGRVTDAVTAAGLGGICVTALPQDRGSGVEANGRTDSSGSYSLSVSDGTYVVEFTDCAAAPVYVTQWWNHAASRWDATPLNLGGLQSPFVKGIDAALERGGSISGQVTDDRSGQPLPGICVHVQGALVERSVDPATDAQGNYTIADLPTDDDYSLDFYPCAGAQATDGPVYAVDYYHHRPTLRGYTPVSVHAPDQTTVNETMYVGGVITGTVTDAATGQPVSGITVVARSPDGTPSDAATTGADGTYRIAGLMPSDQYTVDFTDFRFPSSYDPLWWNQQVTSTDANVLSIDVYTTTSGIDAAMHHQ